MVNIRPPHFRHLFLFLISFFALTLLACLPATAGQRRTLTIKDWTGRGFPPDLVHYRIDISGKDRKNLRLVNEDGKPLPFQLTPAGNGDTTLSFVARVRADKVATYVLCADGNGPAAEPAVSSTAEGNALVLANQKLAVKVPKPQEISFNKPVAARSLPGPLLAFRGPDGAWRGSGDVKHERKVEHFKVKKTADGPVFTQLDYRITYVDGGFYHARIRVTDRIPFAHVTEEYELGVDENSHYWQLDLTHEWDPDSAENMRVAGQGHSPVKYPALAKEANATPSGPSIGTNFPGGAGAPTRCIHHDSCWGNRYVSYYGVHSRKARKTSPGSYPLAIVAPLHKGAWRRANSIPVYVDEDRVRVRFPMDVAPLSWKNEPASDVSPFSCHEHDPSLPADYGRRVWGLVLAHPAFEVAGYGDKRTKSVGYSVRNLYGTVGLNRYKDFILSWDDGNIEYPRVFMTPQQAGRYRQAVKNDRDFPLRKMVENYYWFTQDPKTAQQELPQVLGKLKRNIHHIITRLSIHHHHTLSQYGKPIGHTESVLSWPDLPEEDRQTIKARLALLCYLLVDPDVTSAGDSSHHGNPNMGVSRLMDRSNLMAMIPTHPMFDAWREYMGMFMEYKMGSFMAPEGSWFEYGASYHMHGYSKIERGLMGIFSSEASMTDRLWHYNRIDFDYFLNLLSPNDPRYNSRIIPGMANAPAGQSPHYLQAMGTVSERDPDFAADLRWAWNANGRMVGTGADALTIPAMVRPWIEPKKADLKSRSYPGFGVIFRAHQGPNETALYLRSGYNWSHWNQDQGNLILYSRGAVLLPPQPYQYGRPSNPAFPDKNFLRFGAPVNDLPHAWPDSNILDAHFATHMDYAWSSTGYPEWFISPGGRKGWSRRRKLIEDLGQKEGAFTWDRQIAFMKGKTATDPNYFVVRDSTNANPSLDPADRGKLASWLNLSLLGRKNDLTVANNKIMLDTEWTTDLDVMFPGRKELTPEVREDELHLSHGYQARVVGDHEKGDIVSEDWISKKGTPLRFGKNQYQNFNGSREQHIMVRMQNEPGQGTMWLLYPRKEDKQSPDTSLPAPGVMKVVTSESTDYVFLSTMPLEYERNGVVFNGRAGAVRLWDNGKITLALSAGPGEVGYKRQIIKSAIPFEKTVETGADLDTMVKPPEYVVEVPDIPSEGKTISDHLSKFSRNGTTTYVLRAPATKTVIRDNIHMRARHAVVRIRGARIRFTVPEMNYAQLSVGNVGVRGMGPFDLTFTPESITGQVDGKVRTLVTTWPRDIVRPAYWMDGVRYYAGFADEHSIVKGKTTPQFAIAMGVSDGSHKVKISEWAWPVMPPSQERRSIAIK
ncbi:MAG: hypothetical protein ACLFWL_04010 [Candidatus Brocadiia bacterium]